MRQRLIFNNAVFSAAVSKNKKAPELSLGGFYKNGAPDWVRTNDLQIRSLTL